MKWGVQGITGLPQQKIFGHTGPVLDQVFRLSKSTGDCEKSNLIEKITEFTWSSPQYCHYYLLLLHFIVRWRNMHVLPPYKRCYYVMTSLLKPHVDLKHRYSPLVVYQHPEHDAFTWSGENEYHLTGNNCFHLRSRLILRFDWTKLPFFRFNSHMYCLQGLIHLYYTLKGLKSG